MRRYTVDQVKARHLDVTAEEIRAGKYLKFAVVEEQSNEVITVWIESIDEKVYRGEGVFETVDFTYGVVVNGRDVEMYGDESVEIFVENYLSQCRFVCEHWTVGA